MVDKRYNTKLNYTVDTPTNRNGRRGKITVKRLSLERLQDRFSKLVCNYLAENDLNQGELAERIKMQRAHLNMLINGTRPLSAYYLMKFIQGGIIRVADIYNGKSESKREEEFWATASEAENYALLYRIAKLRKRGVDVDQLLDLIDPSKTPKESK